MMFFSQVKCSFPIRELCLSPVASSHRFLLIPGMGEMVLRIGQAAVKEKSRTANRGLNKAGGLQ